MSEGDKAPYLRMIEEVWDRVDLDAVDEFCASDLPVHNALADEPFGSDGIRATVSLFRSTFPEFKLTVHSVIADTDKVAIYWTTRGTHNRDLMGIPATGRQIETRGVSVVRLEDGKIAEIWGASDQLGVMRKLGAIAS